MARVFSSDVRPAPGADFSSFDGQVATDHASHRQPAADGPGWYESSRELLLGLIVKEWSLAEAMQLDCMPARVAVLHAAT